MTAPKLWRLEREAYKPFEDQPKHVDWVIVGDDSYPGSEEGSTYEIGRFSCQDDARLANAAPDLFEAAVLFENWLAGVSMADMPDVPTEPRGFGASYNKAYAAIDKARGQS